MNRLPKRSEIAEKDTWKLEDVYATDDLWEADMERLAAQWPEIAARKGKLAQSGEYLAESLDAYYAMMKVASYLFFYATERYHQDTADGARQEQLMRVQSLVATVQTGCAFLWPEILAMDAAWITEQMEQVPALAFYRRVIEQAFADKEHILSTEMEALLADAAELADNPSATFKMFQNADVRFGTIQDENGDPVEVTLGRFLGLMGSPDRRVRKDAFETLYQTYEQYRNTLASTFSGNIKQAMFYAKARKYPSTRAMYLNENHIPEQVYDNLLSVVHERMDLMYRYVRLRKKVLGVEDLHMYDLYTPLVSDVEGHYEFERAKQMVKEGLQPLGEEYLNILQEGFDNRWIDVYMNEGKEGGAHSWSVHGVHPVVLLNYNYTLKDVFTLAHEMGHAIHSYYSNSNQPFVYSEYKIFVAEVASTCNEALLIQYLLGKTEDKKQKAYLVNHFLESFRTTLFRQAMFAEFEMIMHRKAEAGEALTAEVIKGVYKGLNELYFGPDMVVDDGIALEWARIPHFYTPFYVYQYSTGFSAAIALSRKILKEGASAVEDYKKFLKGGDSKDPIDLLRIAGVDMESPKPVEQAMDFFEELLDQMEELLA